MTVSARLGSAWRSLDRRAVDVVLALALLALMVAELVVRPATEGTAPTRPIAYVWAVAIVVPFLLHRRFPRTALLIATVAIIGYSTAHFVAFPGYAAFALVFVISFHSGRGAGVLAYFAMTLAVGEAIGLQPQGVVSASTWVTCLLALTVAWLAGDNLRVRQERWVALQARARRLETEREERARQAVTAERLRIARELHDVVAHSMSVIAVQAGVANHVMDSRPEQARVALATVETNSRAALVEMRRLLGVLRQENEPATLAPAPGLADVPRLVDQFRDAGLGVDVEVTGVRTEVPEGVDLSAFRIVQEGLTNVLRHGGPQAALHIAYAPTAVRIAIEDDGPGDQTPPEATPSRRTAPVSTLGGRIAPDGTPGGRTAPEGAPSGRTLPDRAAGGPGHGLIGMRERVAIFGGSFTAQPRPGGGFDVVATLPYAEMPVEAAA
jgi:signal transduction histidine kinase